MANKLTRSIRVPVGQQRMTAPVVPGSFNREARTVDVCFGTDKPVLMGWWDKFYEILSFDEGHVRMERINAGAPMFDNHRNSGTADQPGNVVKAWVKDGMGYATLRFSNDASDIPGVPHGPGEKIMRKVEDGTVRCVSVGYNVFAYEEVQAAGSTTDGKASANSIPTYRATEWEPFEVSFVSVPADFGASVRSAGQEPEAYNVNIFTNQNEQDPMFKRHLEPGTPGEGAGGGTATPAAAATPAATENRAAATPAATPPAPAPVGEDAQTRAMEIMNSCVRGNLPVAFAQELIGNGKTLSECRSLIIDKMAAGQADTATNGQNRAAGSHIHVGDDRKRTANRAGVENALRNRADSTIALTDEGKLFRGLTLVEIGRELLTDAGINTRGLNKTEIAEHILGMRGRSHMSTGDFPLILGNTIDRTLRAAYASQPSTWRQFCRVVSASDFREKTSVALSELGDLEKVYEGGEYKSDYMTESKESYKVSKWGKKIGVTWETVINDDIGFLTRIPGAISDMVTRKQDDEVYGILLNNPLMGDGKTLFHADHGNLIAVGTDISIDNVGIMRKLFRKQMGMRGKQYLNLTPKYIIVGPEREQKVLQFCADTQLYPQSNDQINVWAKSLIPIVDPRIEDKRWHLACAPGSVDTIEVAFLDGNELHTSTRENFDIDGQETKVRMVMGAKAMDWVGIAKNPGVS